MESHWKNSLSEFRVFVRVIADETIGVFGENTSLASIDDVIVAVLGGGGGGERERGRRQASIGRIAPKKYMG